MEYLLHSPMSDIVLLTVLILELEILLINLRGGAGREKSYILNGHIFVNTYQNCTKFSVVVYCVDI